MMLTHVHIGRCGPIVTLTAIRWTLLLLRLGQSNVQSGSARTTTHMMSTLVHRKSFNAHLEVDIDFGEPALKNWPMALTLAKMLEVEPGSISPFNLRAACSSRLTRPLRISTLAEPRPLARTFILARTVKKIIKLELASGANHAAGSQGVPPAHQGRPKHLGTLPAPAVCLRRMGLVQPGYLELLRLAGTPWQLSTRLQQRTSEAIWSASSLMVRTSHVRRLQRLLARAKIPCRTWEARRLR